MATTFYEQLNSTTHHHEYQSDSQFSGPLGTEIMDLWGFEKDFDHTYWKSWFLKYGGYTSIPLSLLYVALVFGGKSWMSNRQPFKLQTPLALWNMALAIMSILIAVRMAPELFLALKNYGLHSTICEWKWETNGATSFWGVLMVFSKLPELGDTAFVVLRKQRLLFLHWYHHMMTLSGWWLVAGTNEPVFLWFAWMNAVVHSFMYSYYALKALKFKLPRNFAMFVTSIQLLQMIVAVAMSSYSVWTMKVYGDESCPHRNWFSLKLSFSVYFSYAILFAKLFIDYYIITPKASPKKID